jgi:hypothetical protein
LARFRPTQPGEEKFSKSENSDFGRLFGSRKPETGSLLNLVLRFADVNVSNNPGLLGLSSTTKSTGFPKFWRGFDPRSSVNKISKSENSDFCGLFG